MRDSSNTLQVYSSTAVFWDSVNGGMDSDEGDSSVVSQEGTVPLSGWQSIGNTTPPPAAAGEMMTSPTRSTSHLGDTEPCGEEKVAFRGESSNRRSPTQGASALLEGAVKVNLLSDVSSQSSVHGVLSNRGLSSPGNEDLLPPLVVGVNPRMINEAAASSSQSLVDREVLVMREMANKSSPSPTPLGRQRRLSLYERANSIIHISNDGKGSGDHNVPPVRSDRSSSSALVKGRDIDTTVSEERTSVQDRKSALGRDKYNTVLRDWLMHVVEKDDPNNAEVRHGEHFRLQYVCRPCADDYGEYAEHFRILKYHVYLCRCVHMYISGHAYPCT